MITQELKKYINEASEVGIGEEEIIINLINAGWSIEDVNTAIENVLHKVAKPKKSNNFISPKPNYFVAFSVIGLLMIGATFYSSNLFVADMEKYLSVNNTANLYEAYNTARLQNIQYESEDKKSTILFVGDIMLSSSRGVGKQIKKENEYRYPFLRISDVLRSADLAFGNLEGPISYRGKDGGSRYSFRGNPKVIEGLKYAGFDVLSIANNHIFDWGKDAFEDTIYLLKANNIDNIGGGMNYLNANKPLVKDVNGTNVAFFAYSMVDYDIGFFEAKGGTPGKSSFNKEILLKKIKKLKKTGVADIVVVSLHWGKEYSKRSQESQQKIAYSLVDAGVDIIVGHHPHVVQEVEKYKDGWIAYSLGNFVFDQNFSEETMRGLMLEVEIKNKKIDKVNPIEIQISETFQPYIKK